MNDQINILVDKYYHTDCHHLEDIIREAYTYGIMRGYSQRVELPDALNYMTRWNIMSSSNNHTVLSCQCSRCGAYDEQKQDAIVPYCWHCGARMSPVRANT